MSKTSSKPFLDSPRKWLRQVNITSIPNSTGSKEIPMNELISLLESLNRKERFFLVGEALGNRSFRLGKNFRISLENASGVSIPPDAWVAMDYHLDWIAAAIHMTINDKTPSSIWENVKKEIVRGNQEDVDLIVGFGDSSSTTLILIEAKGDTPWSKTQMSSKSKRLGKIFGTTKVKNPTITPILVLTSPDRTPTNLEPETWPKWMTEDGEIRWMQMEMKGRRRLVRTDENGKPLAGGGYATLKEKANKLDH
jgi:hypothetical protein